MLFQYVVRGSYWYLLAISPVYLDIVFVNVLMILTIIFLQKVNFIQWYGGTCKSDIDSYVFTISTVYLDILFGNEWMILMRISLQPVNIISIFCYHQIWHWYK